MSLIKNVADLKQLIKLSTTFKLDSIEAFITAAEVKYIIPILGQAQYDALNDAYNADTMSDEQTDLLASVQLPLAQFSFLLYMPTGNIVITNDGFKQSQSDTLQQATKWSYEKLERSYEELAFSGIESLLAFLETNITDYPLWSASSNYTIFKEFFIQTALEFSKYVPINDSRRTFLALKSQMLDVESNEIMGSLGMDYYLELKTKIVDGTLDADDAKLMKFIKPAIAKMTLGKGLMSLTVAIDNTGVSLYNAGSSPADTAQPREPAAMDRLSVLAAPFLTSANNYLGQLRIYLNKNASDSLYPTYYASSAYLDPSKRTEKIKNDASTASFFF